MAAVVLITGATGLIGRYVVAHWALPDLEPVPLSSASDLLSPGAAAAVVRDVRPAAVLHLAWTASGTPGYRDDARNAAWVTATHELADACAEAGAWFVGTGTVVDSAPVDGDTDAYTAAKVRVRRELAPLIDSGGCSWLRPAYVVDPDVGRPAVVAAALAARASGEPVHLRTPGSVHDFVHARDVASAAAVVLGDRLVGEVPIGSGVARPVTDLVAALGCAWVADPTQVAAVAAAPTGVRTAPAPPIHGAEAADIARLREHGWTPFFTEEMFESD